MDEWDWGIHNGSLGADDQAHHIYNLIILGRNSFFLKGLYSQYEDIGSLERTFFKLPTPGKK